MVAVAAVFATRSVVPPPSQINKSRHALKTSSSSPSRGSDGAKASYSFLSCHRIEGGGGRRRGNPIRTTHRPTPPPRTPSEKEPQNFFPGLIMNGWTTCQLTGVVSGYAYHILKKIVPLHLPYPLCELALSLNSHVHDPLSEISLMKFVLNLSERVTKILFQRKPFFSLIPHGPLPPHPYFPSSPFAHGCRVTASSFISSGGSSSALRILYFSSTHSPPLSFRSARAKILSGSEFKFFWLPDSDFVVVYQGKYC